MTFVKGSFATENIGPAKAEGFAIGMSAAQGLGYSQHVGAIASFGGTSHNAEMSVGFAIPTTAQSLASVVSYATGGFFAPVEQGYKEFHGSFVSTPLSNAEGSGNINLNCPQPRALLGIASQVELVCGAKCLTAMAYFNANDSVGNQSVTGIGFEPDFVIFLGPIYRAFDNSALRFCLGVMDKDGNQWSVTEADAYVSNSLGTAFNDIRRRAFYTDRCMYAISIDTVPNINPEQAASFVSMDPDGFTVDWFITGVDPYGDGSKSAVLCLAVKLLDPADGIKVGTITQGDTVITGVGFQPEAVLFASTQQNQGSSTSIGSGLSIGMSDLTNNYVCQRCGERSNTPLNYFDNASCIYFGNTAPTALAKAAVTAFGVDGYTLAWSVDDGLASPIGYVAFKVGGGAPCGFPVFGGKFLAAP